MEGSGQQRRHKSVGWMLAPQYSSLGLLLRVPLLLLPLGVALSHGVDDGYDKVADHDQHHLFKDPREPVLVLGTQQ